MRFTRDVVKIKPSAEFRRMLRDGPLPIRAVSGCTPHHAQLAEAAGCRLFSISGSAMSANLGLPDVGLATLTEVVENARRVCGAVSIPVTVDCDTGFGNPIGVIRTVSEVIGAGVAGFFIEDQASPKRCGYAAGTEIAPLEDVLGKLRAAKDTRDSLDPDVVLIARTDSRKAVGGNLDEVLRRCRAFIDVGVDMLYVSALPTREEIWAVRNAFPDFPIKITPYALKPRITSQEYTDLRLPIEQAKMTTIGSIAMYDFVKDYMSRGSEVYAEDMNKHHAHPLVDFGFLELTGFPNVVELEKKYLSTESLKKYDAA